MSTDTVPMTDADMDKLAEAIDSGASVESQAAPTPASTTTVPGAKKEPTQPQRPTETDKSKAGTGTETDPKTGEPAKPLTPEEEAAAAEAAAEAEGKGDSKYVKAKKDKERLGKTWEQVNAEKTKIEADRKQLEADKHALVERAQQIDGQRKKLEAADPKDRLAKYSDADLLSAADDYEADGKPDLAKSARNYVQNRIAKRQAREEIDQEQTQHTEQFKQHYEHYKGIALKENPELADPNHQLTKETLGLMNDKTYGPVLRSTPMGVWVAKEVCLLRQKAGSVPALEKEVVTLKAEVARLNKLAGVNGSPVNGGPVASKKLTDMSAAEAEQALDRLAEEHDRSGLALT
jgi:hypothetical protein